MEDLLGSEERLQIGDEEEDARVVQSGQLVVQLRVQLLVRTLGLLEQLLATRYLQVVALLRVVLQRLEVVPLAVVVHELAATLVDLFLSRRRRRRRRFNSRCSCAFGLSEGDGFGWGKGERPAETRIDAASEKSPSCSLFSEE